MGFLRGATSVITRVFTRRWTQSKAVVPGWVHHSDIGRPPIGLPNLSSVVFTDNSQCCGRFRILRDTPYGRRRGVARNEWV